MEGVIEAISKERFGIKVGDKWYNAKDKKVQEYFKSLEKGDAIEFNADGNRNLTFVRKKEEKPEEKQKEIKEFQKPEENYIQIMGDVLIAVNDFYNSEIMTKEFKEKLDWTKVVISLFITKVKK